MGASDKLLSKNYRCLYYDKQQLDENQIIYHTIDIINPSFIRKYDNSINPYVERLAKNVLRKWIDNNCKIPCLISDYDKVLFSIQHYENKIYSNYEYEDFILSLRPIVLNDTTINKYVRNVLGKYDSDDSPLSHEKDLRIFKSQIGYTAVLFANNNVYKLNTYLPLLNKPVRYIFVGFGEYKRMVIWNHIKSVNYYTERLLIKQAKQNMDMLDNIPVNAVLNYVGFFFNCLKNVTENSCSIKNIDLSAIKKSEKIINDVLFFNFYVIAAEKKGKPIIEFAQKHEYK